MRSSTLRSGKYSKKITGTVLPGQGRGYLASLPDRTRLEAAVKSVCTSSVLLFSYISFAEQLVKVGRTYSGSTALNEAIVLADKWQARGLAASELNEIGALLGFAEVVPPPPPVTFGHLAPCGTNAFITPDRIRGTQYAFAGPLATLDKMSFLMSSHSGPVKMKCAVYNSPAAVPTTLVASTEERTINNAGYTWEDFNFLGSINIGAGNYFLVIWPDTACGGKYDVGASLRGHHAIVYDGWPSPMPGWTANPPRDLCIYATLTTV